MEELSTLNMDDLSILKKYDDEFKRALSGKPVEFLPCAVKLGKVGISILKNMIVENEKMLNDKTIVVTEDIYLQRREILCIVLDTLGYISRDLLYTNDDIHLKSLMFLKEIYTKDYSPNNNLMDLNKAIKTSVSIISGAVEIISRRLERYSG